MKTLALTLLFLVVTTASSLADAATLAQKLGFNWWDKVLIINADDAGMSHDSNVAVIDAMKNGLVTSATIMVPAPGFDEIAEYARNHPEADFGVHLTHTSEWKTYRWGPVAPRGKVPGLMDPTGMFWPETLDVYMHAPSYQVEIEARAQIEAALAAGIDVTHIDTHMAVMHFKRSYVKRYARLARDYNLPLRMASPALTWLFGQDDIRRELEDDGILMPDRVVIAEPKSGESQKAFWLRVLDDIGPGVTEIYIHPARASKEMQSITNSWRVRAEQYRLFTSDADIRRKIQRERIKLIGYRELRDLQRRNRN